MMYFVMIKRLLKAVKIKKGINTYKKDFNRLYGLARYRRIDVLKNYLLTS